MAHDSTKSLLATDSSNTEGVFQQAATERGLAAGRFEWRAEGWLQPRTLDLFTDADVRSSKVNSARANPLPLHIPLPKPPCR